VLIMTLTVRKLLEVDWNATIAALTGISGRQLAVATALALPAWVACASFDLMGRWATRHSISRGRTMLISFVGYFTALNLGMIAGGLALRLRLYLAHKLTPLTISQVIGLTVLTNWLGLVFLTGIALTIEAATGLLRMAGVGLLLACVAYLVFCHYRGNDMLHIYKARIRVPTLRLAGIQFLVSSINWGGTSGVIAWLIPELDWIDVMPVMAASALIGAWSHVPAGLGVMEAVFVALLGSRVPAAELIAAILILRCIYYLAPLPFALAGFGWLETRARPQRAT
jgi:uncharacterized membrane protein YbhN (UPF0104 family)